MSSRSVDPAQGAAELLRRLGMAILVIALPCAAYFSRGAAIVLTPFGAIILFLATVIDPAEPIQERLKLFARAPAAWIMIGLLAWGGVSLAWAPFPKPATDRFFNAAATLAFTLAAAAAIPERMRAPSLYLLPIGAFVSVVVACLIAPQTRQLLGYSLWPMDATTIGRGAATLVLLTPVALGWLLSRSRGPEAAALAIAVVSAVYLLGDRATMACLGAALAAFAVARLSPGAGARIMASLAALVLLVAPLAPSVAAPLIDALGWREAATTAWGLAEAVWREGVRTLTGHGLESAPRAVGAGLLPLSSAPLLAALWWDLGIVGALGAAAFVLSRGGRGAELSPDLTAAEIGLACAAVAQMATGIATMQAWWLSTIAAAVIAMRAVAKGQFRTRRPRARLFGRAPGGPTAAPA